MPFTFTSTSGSGEGTPGAPGADGEDGSSFGIYYLGNYNAENGYSPDIAVVRGSDGQLYLAKASGQLGDPVGNTAQWEVWIPKGADGTNGTNGTDGATPFTLIGAYDNGASYNLGIAVYYNGGTYVRTGNPLNPGYPPEIGAINGSWTPIAEKGADGSDGTNGTDGTDGENGITVAGSLDNLTDVTITGSPTNQQLLVYDSTTGQWHNADAITSTGLAYKALYPNTKTATGTLGQISIDGANGTMYVCTGTNTWQKISLNSANFTNTGGFD